MARWTGQMKAIERHLDTADRKDPARGEPVLAAAPTFAAVGDATRLKLLVRLSAGGPQSIVQLTAGSNIARQAVTKHLLVLV